MAARHGTRGGYKDGCRCDECRDAQRRYQQRYRERSVAGVGNSHTSSSSVFAVSGYRTAPGPVESRVQAEIGALATQARPGLAAMALSLAQLMDDPRARNQQPAAAKVLAGMLDKLRSVSASGRRGGLTLVRTMIERGGSA